MKCSYQLRCFLVLLAISMAVFLIGCTSDDTVTIESVKVESSDKIRVYFSGNPEDPNKTFNFSIDVEYNGKKEVNYTTGYLTSYSSFHDYVEVKLRKSIPKGSVVTVRPSSSAENLYGSATYTYEGE